jgi:hypothetical protein
MGQYRECVEPHVYAWLVHYVWFVLEINETARNQVTLRPRGDLTPFSLDGRMVVEVEGVAVALRQIADKIKWQALAVQVNCSGIPHSIVDRLTRLLDLLPTTWDARRPQLKCEGRRANRRWRIICFILTHPLQPDGQSE